MLGKYGRPLSLTAGVNKKGQADCEQRHKGKTTLLPMPFSVSNQAETPDLTLRNHSSVRISHRSLKSVSWVQQRSSCTPSQKRYSIVLSAECSATRFYRYFYVSKIAQTADFWTAYMPDSENNELTEPKVRK